MKEKIKMLSCILALALLAALVFSLPSSVPSVGVDKDTDASDHCPHEVLYTSCQAKDAFEHWESPVCDACGKTVSRTLQKHEYIIGVCAWCNYHCKHAKQTVTYASTGTEQHRTTKLCVACGVKTFVYEAHTLVDGTCSICGGTGPGTGFIE